ncbi:MAG: cold shock domain-containing protein [Pseudomonadota bacterium]
MSGIVKWFDPVKGFGFVVADTGGPDILLHVNVLRNFGQSSVVDGARVDLTVHDTKRGVQATAVTAIHPPVEAGDGPSVEMNSFEKPSTAQGPFEPARVKWFDKDKGFGFANIFGRPADVFLHIEILRQGGLSDLQPGEALAVRVVDGKRGSMAAEVQAWEKVVEPASDDAAAGAGAG